MLILMLSLLTAAPSQCSAQLARRDRAEQAAKEVWARQDKVWRACLAKQPAAKRADIPTRNACWDAAYAEVGAKAVETELSEARCAAKECLTGCGCLQVPTERGCETRG